MDKNCGHKNSNMVDEGEKNWKKSFIDDDDDDDLHHHISFDNDGFYFDKYKLLLLFLFVFCTHSLFKVFFQLLFS